jgi:Protein of unknown function (DUF1588)/Protein of unknown function (DUF1587)/Protein of unknown function (DUF1592)/Protein of unknown function (DUF1585)/Protein of unknown function (DUF1595)/Planctomycete cytochrome C
MHRQYLLHTAFFLHVVFECVLARSIFAAEKPAEVVAHFKSQIQPILAKNCYQCHGDGESEGKVAFDALDDEASILDPALWQRVLKNVRAGIMPPAGETPPTAEEVKQLEHWIKYEAFGIDADNPDPGRVTLRRLNRNEYGHTIQDLLGYDYHVEDNFPPDDTGHGFDNVADVLSMSPILIEKYMRAADQIVHAAVPDVSKMVATKTISGEEFVGSAGSSGHPANRVPFSQAGIYRQKVRIDQAGEYRLTVEFGVYGQFEYDHGRANISFSSEGKRLYQQAHVWQDEKNGLVVKFDFRRNWESGEKDFVFEVETLPMVKEEDEPKWRSQDNQADETIAAKKSPTATPEEIALGNAANPVRGPGPEVTRIELQIVGVTIEGPLDKERWVNPPNYNRFFSRSEPPADDKERREYARQVLRTFAGRAFRRPVDEPTLDRLVSLAETVYVLPDHTFEQGIQQAMIAVLCSKRFLYRIEQPAESQVGRPYVVLDDFALAARLSYLLWSSTPDDELLAMAERGELRKNLQPQVERMLADPKSQAFVESFVGQWLRTREMDTVDVDSRVVLARDEGTEAKLKAEQEAFRTAAEQKPSDAASKSPESPSEQAVSEPKSPTADQVEHSSPADDKASTNATPKEPSPQEEASATAPPSKEHPAEQDGQPRRRGRRQFAGLGQFGPPPVQLDSQLRTAMRQETESYFSYVAHQNRSVLELIDSDYTFLNERLARHYGIDGVKGSEMRRVTLTKDSHRGGVLTQGAILTITSQSTRTSPVKRGRFVLDNLIGTPQPPAPPNVPALETVEQSFGGREPTLREAMELHRRDAVCASCHARMDPIGLAMENFNALGMWRTRERGQDIVAESDLITGEKLSGVDDLRKLIVNSRRTDFYRCMTEKLLIYSLGRGLEYYDVEAVDQIVERLERENGQFSALLLGVVESAPFQKQRSGNDQIAEATNGP